MRRYGRLRGHQLPDADQVRADQNRADEEHDGDHPQAAPTLGNRDRMILSGGEFKIGHPRAPA